MSKYNNKIKITSGRKLPIPKPFDDRIVFDSLIDIQNSLIVGTMEGVDWYDSLVIYVSEFHTKYAWRNIEGDIESPGDGPVPNSNIDYSTGLLPVPHQYSTLPNDIRSQQQYNWFPIKGAGFGSFFSSNQAVTANNLQGFPVGTTFPNSVSFQVMWDTLLFPYVPPEITLTALGNSGELPGYYERGYVIEQITLTTTTIKHSDNIDDVEFFKNTASIFLQSSPDPNGGMDVHIDGVPAAGTPVNSPDTSYYATVLDDPTATTVQSNTVEYKFVYPFYVGEWPDPINPPADLDIQAMTKLVMPKQDSKWTFNFTQERYVFAYPDSYGALYDIYDTNKFKTISDYTIYTYNLTMLDGVVITYRAYVFNLITDAVNFVNHFYFSTNSPT